MCYLGTWIRGRLPRTRHGRADHRDRARARHRAADRRRAEARPRCRPGILSSSASSATWRSTRARPRRCGRRATRCSTRSAPRRPTRPQPQILASKLDLAHRPPARLPDQPQQARLDGAARRVAVRARDAARVLRDPRDQRGREGRRIKVVDYRMIGATGRVYLTGTEADVRAAGDAAIAALGGGRMSVDGADPARAHARGAARRARASCCRELVADAARVGRRPPGAGGADRSRRRPSRRSIDRRRWPDGRGRRRRRGGLDRERRRARRVRAPLVRALREPARPRGDPLGPAPFRAGRRSGRPRSARP